jgi:hypothetical protein
MNLLAPAALGLAGLVVPLFVLYMLRSRRRRVEISSTRLWQAGDLQVTSAVPWSRIRWTALLMLQLAALLLFVFALARPFLNQRTVLGPHSVFVMDTSGSMAEDNRIGDAKERALELAEDISDGNLISIIDAGPNPRVVIAHAR